MFGIGFNEMLIILAVALIVLGPDKLPEIATALGKAMRQIRHVTDDITKGMMADTGLKETAESLRGALSGPSPANMLKKTIMAQTGLQETADQLKKALLPQANQLKDSLLAQKNSLQETLLAQKNSLQETAEGLKKSLQVDTSLSRGELRQIFEDIEDGKPRPAAAVEGQPAPGPEAPGPEVTVASAEQAAAPAPASPSPAGLTPAARFADDDAD